MKGENSERFQTGNTLKSSGKVIHRCTGEEEYNNLLLSMCMEKTSELDVRESPSMPTNPNLASLGRVT